MLRVMSQGQDMSAPIPTGEIIGAKKYEIIAISNIRTMPFFRYALRSLGSQIH